MSDRNVSVGIDIVADGAKAAAAFNDTASAADKFGASVEDAGRKAKTADDGFKSAADGADNMASKASQATGGIGALASGFELVGLGEFAGGMQSAAMATDFFSGVGDIANLVLESQAVQTIKNTALKVKDAVVTKAQAVATGAMTAAQWLLNAAMNANPIGLIIAGIVALTAVVIIAYKKSDTFRKIVNAALTKVKEVAASVFGWLKSHWPLILAILTGPFGLAVLAIVKNWAKIKGAAKAAFDFVADAAKTGLDNVVGFVRDVPGKILDLAGDMKDAGKTLIEKFIDGLKQVGQFAAGLGTSIINGVLGAINTGIRWINDHIPDKIELFGLPDIDLPDNPFPEIPTIGSSSSKTSSTSSTDLDADGKASTQTIQITVNGAIDPYSTAVQVKALLDRADRWRGKVVTVNG